MIHPMRFLVPALLILAACAPDEEPAAVPLPLQAAEPDPDSLPVHFYSTDPELAKHARAAALEWNACGGRQAIVDDGPSDGAVPIIRVHPDDPELQHHSGVTMTWCTDAERRKCRASYTKVIQHAADESKIVAHEMGHALITWRSGRDADAHFGEGLMTASGSAEHVGPFECRVLTDRL